MPCDGCSPCFRADAPSERVKVLEALTELEALWLDNPEEARRLLHAEQEGLGDASPRLTATLTFAMARERAACGDHDAAEALAEEARARASAAGDRVLEAAAAATLSDAAHCRLRRDDPAALATVDRKIAEAGALVDDLSDEQMAERLQVFLWLFMARYFTGGFPAAREGRGPRPADRPPHRAGPPRGYLPGVLRNGRLGDGSACRGGR